ncbi:MAG: 4-hydroxythreonine-4-phosphate dehydrogenase PdxA [Verrucomicrobiales bacterium]
MEQPSGAATPETLGVIGLTLGDPAGIGPEIIAAAQVSARLDARFDYRIIGAVPPGTVPGRPTPASARAAWDALKDAAGLLNSGEIAAVVTGPVSKHALAEIGFPHPGQTEFFAKALGANDYAMLLTGRRLTVALVTWHIPLAEVSRQLRLSEVVRVGRLLYSFLRTRGIEVPRIAVPGLNPHAGENGLLGREEIETVAPSVAALQQEFGRAFTGPIAADTLFHRTVSGEFDAVLCLYHDQGLIPLKLLDFDNAVNVTLGLPVVRTSPDHGTAFDIAGRGRASPESFISATNLAAELTVARLAQAHE